jgi:hypothetical protein
LLLSSKDRPTVKDGAVKNLKTRNTDGNTWLSSGNFGMLRSSHLNLISFQLLHEGTEWLKEQFQIRLQH